MKKSKFLTIIIYIGVLILAFSWMMRLFGGSGGDLSYSQVVKLFQDQQVKSFVIRDDTIYLKLHAEYKGKTSLSAPMADPEGFVSEMWQLLQEQTQAGTLESYDICSWLWWASFPARPLLLRVLSRLRRRTS